MQTLLTNYTLTAKKLIADLVEKVYGSTHSAEGAQKLVSHMLGTHAEIGVRLFREGAIMPSRGSDLAAGFDLYAWIPEPSADDKVMGVERERDIPPNSMIPIKTGINLRIPAGFEVQIRPRSGLAFKSQITVQNTPGTIDADYDGDGESFEIVVMLRNESNNVFRVKHGDRIAQMVVNKLPDVTLRLDTNDNVNRNQSNREGGLGSTGTK